MTTGMMIENVLQVLLTGILVGGVYGLLCVGLGMIFSVMRVINFAQGEFMMVGMYGALFCFQALGFGVVFGVWIGLIMSAATAGVMLYALGSVLHPTLLARCGW